MVSSDSSMVDEYVSQLSPAVQVQLVQIPLWSMNTIPINIERVKIDTFRFLYGR